MRVAAHLDHAALKEIASLMRMGGIGLRVLCAFKVINIIALDRLREEGDTQGHDQGEDDQNVAKHFRSRRIWCNPLPTSCLRL